MKLQVLFQAHADRVAEQQMPALPSKPGHLAVSLLDLHFCMTFSAQRLPLVPTGLMPELATLSAKQHVCSRCVLP